MKKSQEEQIEIIKHEYDLWTPEKQVAVTGYLLDDRKQFEELSNEQAEKLINIHEDTPGHYNFALQRYEEEQELIKQGKDPAANPGSQSNVHLETVTEETSATSMSHFTDDDTGEVIELTPKFVNRAHEVQGFIRGSFYLLAEGLAAMADEKLYGAFGYTSFKDYCQNELDFGVRQAYRYAVIGRSVAPHLQLGNGTNKENKKSLSNLDKVGTTKLNEIIKRAEDQVERLVKEGKITIGDEELSAEDLADRRVSELKEMLKNADKKAANAELLEEQKKNLEMQKEALEEENAELAAFKEKYKDRAENREEVEEILTQAENLREKVVVLVNKLSPEVMFEHSSEEQQERLVRFLDLWQKSGTRQKNKHLAMVEAIWEESMDLTTDELNI